MSRDSCSVRGNVIIIDQDPGREVSDADWGRFSVDYQIVNVMGTSENYSADTLVGIVFTPGKAQFYCERGCEENAGALAVAFAARFGGTMRRRP
jgi:hypothetical protein